MRNKDIHWQGFTVKKEDRQSMNEHRSAVVWLTGLSGSGKSTIANMLESKLFSSGIHTFILDGDNVRHGLNKDLGFSEDDRKENIRRIGEVAKLFVESGCLVIATFISPYREDREKIRRLMAAREFIEVYIECPLQVCEQRDPKNLYKKARSGLISGFTGIDAPYEPPEKPELSIRTDVQTVDECVEKIISYLQQVNII